MADVVDWLVENRTPLYCAQLVGDLLPDKVLPELEGRLEPHDWQVQKHRQLDHFWCDLLVGMALAIDEYDRIRAKAPDLVASWIISLRDEAGRAAVSDEVVGIAVQIIWKALDELLYVTRLSEVLRAVRILAVLLCKAPEEHREVVQFCIVPLTKEIISPATRERLQEAFPVEWSSRLHRSLSG